MRTNRFAALTTPLHTSSLHRIKTAFSPSRQHTSNRTRTTSPSSIASSSTSPLSEPRTRTSSHEDLSPLGAASPGSSCYAESSPMSSASKRLRIRQALRIRAMGRRPSLAVMEMEEERRRYATEIGILEPRPKTGVLVGGIFEVLEGKA